MNQRQLHHYKIISRIVKAKGGKILSDYVRSGDKVKVQCSKQHIFYSSPSKLKMGKWCKKCAGNCPQEAEKKLKNIIDGKRGKLLTPYIKSGEKVLIECEHGHEFWMKPNHVGGGTWCPACAKNSRIYGKRNFIDGVADKNGEVIGKYVRNKSHVRVKCQKGHIFTIAPSNVKQGRWCGLCSGSYGEQMTSIALDNLDIKYKFQHSICGVGKRRYDFFLPELNTLVEYDGMQHFKFVEKFYGTIEEYNKRRGIDLEKTNRAIDNHIKLIRISYSHKTVKSIQSRISEALSLGNKLYLSSDIYKTLLPKELIEQSNLNLCIPKRRCKLIFC